MIVFVCLSSMILATSACQTSEAQRPILATSKGVGLTDAQKQKVKDSNIRYQEILRPINELISKARKSRSLTDEDIAKIRELETSRVDVPSGVTFHPSLQYVVRTESLKPLASLTPKTLKSGQEAAIIAIILPILTAPNPPDDREGDAKMFALDVVNATLRDKDLLPTIRKLKSDKYEAVRIRAKSAERKLLGSR